MDRDWNDRCKDGNWQYLQKYRGGGRPYVGKDSLGFVIGAISRSRSALWLAPSSQLANLQNGSNQHEAKLDAGLGGSLFFSCNFNR